MTCIANKSKRKKIFPELADRYMDLFTEDNLSYNIQQELI